MLKTGQIETDFVVLDAEKHGHIENNDTNLYQRLDSDYQSFKNCELIACHEFSHHWPTWEKHPHGDEVVMLLAGEITFLLHTDDGIVQQTLSKEGSYLIVPRDTWHTAKIDSFAKVLFVTPGEDTQNKALP